MIVTLLLLIIHHVTSSNSHLHSTPPLSMSTPLSTPTSTAASSTSTTSMSTDGAPSLRSKETSILLDEQDQSHHTRRDKGFVDSAMSMASSAGSAVAGTAMNAMYDKGCVMCEYILEQVDKMIKAQPRMMNGNGYYPGVMDFGGGVQQGNYRIYQGSYVEMSEEKKTHTYTHQEQHQRKKGDGAVHVVDAVKEVHVGGETLSSFADKIISRRKGTSTSIFGAANGHKRVQRAQRKHDKSQSSHHLGRIGRFTENQRQAAMERFQEHMRTGETAKLTAAKSLLFAKDSAGIKKGGASNSKGGASSSKSGSKSGLLGAAAGAAASLLGGGSSGGMTNRVKVGRHTFKDQDLTDDQVEKDQEFATMYKDFMDAMDDVCFHDLPKKFQQNCKHMYYYGDRVVEMYLHDYDDFEICAQIPMQCIPSWFDEGAKSMWRR
jgi:hypothetical protein